MCSIPEPRWWSHPKHTVTQSNAEQSKSFHVFLTLTPEEAVVLYYRKMSALQSSKVGIEALFDLPLFLCDCGQDIFPSQGLTFLKCDGWRALPDCRGYCEDEMRSWRNCSLQERGKVSTTGGEGSMTFHLSEPHLQAPVGSVLDCGFLLHLSLKKTKQNFPLIWCLDAMSLPSPPPQNPKPKGGKSQHSHTEFTPCSPDLNNTSTIS